MWITDWTRRAACKGTDPDNMFVQGAAQNRQTVICRGCPVRTECLADALDNGIEFGIWGGMTERERRALLRRRPDVASWRNLLERAREAYERDSLEEASEPSAPAPAPTTLRTRATAGRRLTAAERDAVPLLEVLIALCGSSSHWEGTYDDLRRQAATMQLELGSNFRIAQARDLLGRRGLARSTTGSRSRPTIYTLQPQALAAIAS